jgi:hypothetical protein
VKCVAGCGERLIARRTAHFEVWAIDKVAALTDRHGQHYSSELRFVAYDSLT